MKRIDITDSAKADLESIWLYVAKQNVFAADALIDRIVDRVLSLAYLSSRGTLKPGLQEGVRSLIEGDYLILYRESQSNVAIFRIVHGARDVSGIDL